MTSARRVAGLLFGSGLCALVYQTVWLREFRLIFGASTPASAAVLAIFMGGLGFGGILLGRRLERSRLPLGAYAKLELAIAALAALSPFLLDLVRRLYLASGGSAALGEGLATLLRLFFSALVLGPIVLLMGGTLPAAARAVTRQADRTRLALALLYGLNTLGAVLGVLIGTFFSFEAIGFRRTLWVACAANALIAWLAWRWARQGAGADSSAAAEPPAREASAPAAERGVPRALVLCAAFVSGFVFLLLELLWYRMSAPILGGSTYTFGVILATALLGIGLGGLAYGLQRGVRPSPGLFALTCALEAVLLLAPFAAGDELALLASSLRTWGQRSFGLLVTGWAAVAGLLVLPASLVAGYQFPLLMALSGQGRTRVARDVGELYAANTAGAIAGSLLGGFLLIPGLGAERAWQGAGLALLALGALLLASAGRAELRRWLPFAVLGLLGLAFARARGPTALWRHMPIGAGRAELQLGDGNDAEHTRTGFNRRMLETHEGRESSLAFMRAKSLAVMVNGKSDGDVLGDAGTTVGLGLVPALVHGSPRQAFVIGLASGVTGGWLAEVPGMERVDVAEIEPDMLRFSALSAPANFDVNRHPKVRILIGDGRELLLASRERYDLIVSEPSNPYRAGIASFYTREFYREARRRMAPGGLFSQWVQSYEVDAGAIQIIARTLRHVFAHVSLWSLGQGDLLFLASAEPHAPDAERLRRQTGEHPFREYLGRIAGVHGLEGLLAMHVAGEAFLAPFAEAGATISTDDLPALEFLYARSVGRDNEEELVEALFRLARARGADRATVNGAVDGTVDWALVDRFRVRNPSLWRALEAPEGLFWRAFERQDHAQMTRRPEDLAGLPPGDHLGTLARLQVRALAAASPEAFASAEREIEAWTAGGNDRLLAWLLCTTRAGKVPESQALYARLIEAAREDPWMNRTLLAPFLAREVREPRAARVLFGLLAARPLAAYLLEQRRQESLQQLLPATVLDGEPDPACLELLVSWEPWPVWTEEMLRLRAGVYASRSHPLAARAREDLARFLGNRGRPARELLPPR